MILRIELSINPSILTTNVIDIKVDAEKKMALLDTSESSTNFVTTESVLSFQDFMNSTIETKSKTGHIRTAEAYQSALNSFNVFHNNQPLAMSDINDKLMEHYETYLINRGVCLNTVSFYMRILKAVYKKAVRQKLVVDKYPFQQVYTGVAKTKKRSVDIDGIRKIFNYEPENEKEEFAKDLFLFSFYTRGMSFVDIAMLKKEDISGDIMEYKRKKTGLKIRIRWEPAMQAIVDKYKPANNVYLLPIIRKVGKGERNQYRYTQYIVNVNLKKIGERLMLNSSLTMYVARHSWASIAKASDVPLAVISEAMGHTSEKMTSIYLNSIDEAKIHDENRRIISMVSK